MAGMMGAWRSFGQDSSVLKQKVKPGTAKRTLRSPCPTPVCWRCSCLWWSSMPPSESRIRSSFARSSTTAFSRELHAHHSSRRVVAVLGSVRRSAGHRPNLSLVEDRCRDCALPSHEVVRTHPAMPLAFFTRAQTGALVSRLNTDVGGARTAFTDILSNVVGNLITVILILGAMFVLSWRITLAALVLLPCSSCPRDSGDASCKASPAKATTSPRP
jgi:ATP-binding cassette, subfamily B, bacterial